jgi:hypothetical protein
MKTGAAHVGVAARAHPIGFVTPGFHSSDPFCPLLSGDACCPLYVLEAILGATLLSLFQDALFFLSEAMRHALGTRILFYWANFH